MSETPLVLVLDQNGLRASDRAEQLRLDGFDAERASTDAGARGRLPDNDFVVLGELEGGPAASLALLRDLRAGLIRGTPTHLRVITFADSEAQLLSAVRAGADMTLPSLASPTLVSASVEALARRRWSHLSEGVLRLGSLELDRGGRTASVNGAEVALTSRQFQLLEAMAKTPGRVYTRDELSREVWGGPDIRGSRAVDQQVSRLRQSLSAAGAQHVIKNVRGHGFKLSTGAER